MDRETSAPPPYDTSYQTQPTLVGSTPYPNQSSYPAALPPTYTSASAPEQSKPYPVQAGAAPYPQAGANQPYGQPAYPVQGSATGYTTQGVGAMYNAHTQTTIITQQPGVAGIYVQHVAPPNDYLAASIIGTFCCFCIGVFALLRSLKSRDMYRTGNLAAAQQLGLEAKKLAYTAIFVAICTYVFIVILRIVLSLTLD